MDKGRTMRQLMLAGCVMLGGCASFETLSSSPEQITYRFDPTQVSPQRVAAAKPPGAAT